MALKESILLTIRELRGISEDDNSFDDELMAYINGSIVRLNSIGIGPKEGFRVTDETSKWNDLLGDRIDLENVKTFIDIDVRLLFDPPSNAFLVTALKAQREETLFILSVADKEAEPA